MTNENFLFSGGFNNKKVRNEAVTI